MPRVNNILLRLAFIQFIGLVVFKLFFILNKCPKLLGCVCVGQHDEDEWELFEQAVLHRERESDSNKDSEESGSMESLLIY